MTENLLPCSDINVSGTLNLLPLAGYATSLRTYAANGLDIEIQWRGFIWLWHCFATPLPIKCKSGWWMKITKNVGVNQL